MKKQQKRELQTKNGTVYFPVALHYFLVSNEVTSLLQANKSPGKWQADATAKSCQNCKSAFSFWKRRHHCRSCGLIFCDECTAARRVIPGKSPNKQRVCVSCDQFLSSDKKKKTTVSASTAVASNTGRQRTMISPSSPTTPPQKVPRENKQEPNTESKNDKFQDIMTGDGKVFDDAKQMELDESVSNAGPDVCVIAMESEGIEEDVESKIDEDEKTPDQDPLLVISDLLFAGNDKDAMIVAEKEEMGVVFGGIKNSDEKVGLSINALNMKRIADFEAVIEAAKKDRGDVEITEARVKKALYCIKIGNSDTGISELDEILPNITSKQKIDLLFVKARLGFALDALDAVNISSMSSHELVADAVSQANIYVEKGGDWEQKNLLMGYEALFFLRRRQFSSAAPLLVKSLATFTGTILYSFKKLVFYAVLAAVISFDRTRLRSEVIRSPEILQSIEQMPSLKQLLFCLDKCDYLNFFKALVAVTEVIKQDRHIATHLGWWLREARIVAYRQYLWSYNSVKIDSMAQSFGVSVKFLDSELSRFIAAGRLQCQIDAVEGVVKSHRWDLKFSQYADVIREGDTLLTKLQKLANSLG